MQRRQIQRATPRLRDATRKALPCALMFAVFVAIALQSAVSHARFNHLDSETVDREADLDTETWNDILSYRSPLVWDRLWDATNVGLRVSAGSHDANRFLYSEDIRFRSNDTNRAVFAFTQSRAEDKAEQNYAQEIRVGVRAIGHLQVSILGETTTFKEHGDIGFATAWFESWRRYIEVYWWSVDHYYAQKKSDSSDSMSATPWTLGLRGEWELDPWVQAKLRYEKDGRTKWDRPSRGFSYAYRRTTLDWHLASGPRSSWQIHLAGRSDEKSEDKYWANSDDTSYEKSFTRDASQLELAGTYLSGTTEYNSGFVVIKRSFDAEFRGDPLISPQNYSETSSPSVSRDETAWYATAHLPWPGSSTNFVQAGCFWNNVLLNESEEMIGNEIKLQTAWELCLRPKCAKLSQRNLGSGSTGRGLPLDRRWGIQTVGWRKHPVHCGLLKIVIRFFNNV